MPQPIQHNIFRLVAAAFILVAGLVFCPALNAQTNDGVHDNLSIWGKTQVWDFFGGAKQGGWSVDLISRRQSDYDDNNFMKYMLRTSIRPWVFWQISPTARLSFSPFSWHYDGGLRATEANQDGLFRNEFRSTIEFDNGVFLNNIIMLSHRYRFEGRLLFPGEADQEFLLRLRTRLRVRVSVNDLNYYDEGCIYGFGYNEVALQYGVAGPDMWLNQNRSFLGAGYRFHRYMRVEFGYVSQWAKPRAGDHYFLSHGPMAYFLIDYLSALEPKEWVNSASDWAKRLFGPSGPSDDPFAQPQGPPAPPPAPKAAPRKRPPAR